jgi:small subunit ribosomal protein S17
MAEEHEETTEEAPEQPVSAAESEAAAEPEAPAAEAEAEAEEPAESAPESEAEQTAGAEEAPADEPEAEQAAVAEEAPASETAQPRRKRKRLPRSERRQRPKPVPEKPEKRRPIVRLPKPEAERGARQERRGVVVSNAMDKTIVVRVETRKAHARYKKIIRRSTKFHAHDERNEASVGDVVRIVETRPLSRTKRWRLAEIIEAAK